MKIIMKQLIRSQKCLNLIVILIKDKYKQKRINKKVLFLKELSKIIKKEEEIRNKFNKLLFKNKQKLNNKCKINKWSIVLEDQQET